MKITKKEFIMMLGGMFLMSAAVYYEMMPNNLVLGSLSGLVLVLVKIIPLPVSTITFVLNMILFGHRVYFYRQGIRCEDRSCITYASDVSEDF